MKKNQIQIKLFLCAAFLLFSAKITFSQNLKLIHGPIIQHLTDNSVVINWSTSINSVAWVEYYEEDDSNFYQKERKKVFNSTAGIKTIDTLHKVILRNLKPSTKYAYRIYSQEVTKDGKFGKTVATRVYKRKPLYFSTQDPIKKQTSCVILTDIHEDAELTGKLLEKVDLEETDFVLINGDFVDQFNNDEDLYATIDTCVDEFAKEKPLYIVRGNHETRGSKAPLLNKYFHFPDHKYYYTFSYGTTFFIVLDSGEDKPDSDIEYYGLADYDSYRSEQAKWLEQVVESKEYKMAKQKIVFMHIPPYMEESDWHGTLDVRKKFMPILNKAGIDLMISGHTHYYSYIPVKVGKNNFPIIIQDNNAITSLSIDSEGIKVKMINEDSEIISDVFFEIQQ